jgi:hypothetical protein
MYTRPRKHTFEVWYLTHKLAVLERRTKSHDTLNTCPVIPGSIIEHDLTSRRQVLYIALEIPLRTLAFRRLFEGNHPCRTRIQVFREALYGATLAGCIAALEQSDYSLARKLGPVLYLKQLYLKLFLMVFINRPLNFFLVWILALPEQITNLFRAMLNVGKEMRGLSARLVGADLNMLFFCFHSSIFTIMHARTSVHLTIRVIRLAYECPMPPLRALHPFALNITGNHYLGIRPKVELTPAATVLHETQDEFHGLKPRPLLVIGADHPPRVVGSVRALEEPVLCFRKLFPKFLCLQVYLAQLPLAQGIVATTVETTLLLLLRDGEIQLDQDGLAVRYEAILVLVDLLHEVPVLLLSAEAHNGLDHGAVIPTAVKQHDLAGMGEVLDVALHVQFSQLIFSWLAQGDHAIVLLIHVARDAPDCAALPGGVTPVKEDDHLATGGLEMGLQTDEFPLVGLEFLSVDELAQRGGYDLVPVLLFEIPNKELQLLLAVAAIRVEPAILHQLADGRRRSPLV